MDSPVPPRFTFGLDIGGSGGGEKNDYTARAIIESVGADYFAPASVAIPAHLHLIDLGQPPLGTPYTKVASDMRKLFTTGTYAGKSELVVDATGVGRAVVDMFVYPGAGEESLQPSRVTITGGDKVAHEGREWHVPKRDLVGALLVAFQNRVLRVADGVRHRQEFIDQLMNFKYKISERGHDTYDAKDGYHDDLVIAVALAVWRAQHRPVAEVGTMRLGAR